MAKVTTDSSTTDEDDSLDSDVVCLMRVGRNSGWLRLVENTEVTIGRGFDVTYQLLSPSCPLMISRLHCTFSQRKDGHWTVTDKESLNGVWVNGIRIPPQKPQLLQLGDSIHLGVPVMGSKVEFDYKLVQRPLREIKHNLAKDAVKTIHIPKKSKRKLPCEEVEPSTSTAKLYRCAFPDKSLAQPCPPPLAQPHKRHACPQSDKTPPNPFMGDVEQACGGVDVPCDLDNLQMYSQNIFMLKEQLDTMQRQVASLEGEAGSSDPLREEQINELQGQLKILHGKMKKMEMFERTYKENKRRQQAQKTLEQKELLEKQLEDPLQEQRKVIDELTLSRTRFEEILLAKNKELVIKKDEVVTQVTKVLETELQCIICSELLIEVVTLNCGHSFCCHCIKQWRKKKEECPICRQAIKSQSRCLALDNYIDSVVENLSLDMRTSRQTLVSERREISPPDAHASVIQDEESNSSVDSLESSSDCSSSIDSLGTPDGNYSPHHSSSSHRLETMMRAAVVVKASAIAALPKTL
ncbi:E3 ubiquitin-protein ligase rnf8 isoform X2 [Vanacampus margaritifer]